MTTEQEASLSTVQVIEITIPGTDRVYKINVGDADLVNEALTRYFDTVRPEDAAD